MSNWTWGKVIVWGLVATVAIWILGVAPALLAVFVLPESKLAQYGNAGDMFGASSALFSGLGFLGVLLVLFFDLKERRRDLTHRKEDFVERKRSLTPLLVPSITESGARVVRATKVSDTYAEASLTLSLQIQNVTDQPAMNTSLKSFIVGQGMPVVNTEIDDSPFGTGEAAKRFASLHFSAAGGAAEKILERLASGSSLTIVVMLQYASINGTRWESEVRHELSSRPNERTLFQGILDGDKDSYIEERPGFSSGEDIFLGFKVVPNSWKHTPLDEE
ncbi:hypothetical protein [Ornithinimicrobium cerasi]|uniref:hypothetical protein n=1 Tax=Ornithinimicrobium cerasi TaxID=2248773 RepID=UPI00137AAC23|nr:hypothetical protein [Ornithinimicrobium cerasi]